MLACPTLPLGSLIMSSLIENEVRNSLLPLASLRDVAQAMTAAPDGYGYTGHCSAIFSYINVIEERLFLYLFRP